MKNGISSAHVLCALATAVAVSSCNCGNNVGAAKKGSVTGVVFKGSVAGATVKAFEANDAGRRGKELGTATAAEDGSFTVEVGSHAGPMVVTATQGTYTEEATGGLVQLGANELSAFVDAHEAGDTTSANLTPLTSLHAGLTACFAESGREATLAGASSRASLRLNDFFSAGVSGFDVRTTVPANPTLGLAASLTPEAWSGIVIAGLSESAKAYAVASGLDPGVRVTAATLTTALQQDIDDGACIFDGRTATAQLLQGDIELTDDALRGSPQGLATSVLRFLEGPQNQSGIAEDNVRDLVQRLQTHTSEIFPNGGQGGDIDGPVVAFSEPEDGSTRGGLVRVTVTAVDASEIVEFAFTAPDQVNFVAVEPTCTDDTKTDCTLTGTINTSAEPVVDGPLTITVRALDDAGNSTTADLDIVVNNTLPQIAISEPADGEEISGGAVRIAASASDADGIETLTVEIPGIGLCSDQPESPCRDAQPPTDQLSVSFDSSALPEGPLELVFRATDTEGNAAEPVRRTVIVDNSELGAITGFVDIGSPVAGATVVALDWSGRVRGAVLGTATTDEEGAFAITIDDAAHASLLLVATGGLFVDLATGGTFSIADGQELTAPLGAFAAGDVRQTNINAWTTLAAARAKHTPAVADDAFAITTNLNLIGQHLRRVPLGAPFSLVTTKSADLTAEIVTIADQRAVLALSHAALSRQAAEVSLAAGVGVGTVTAIELVRVLVLDLDSDPLLDGSNAGSIITIGPALAPITSLTTRFDLAGSLDRWLSEAPLLDSNDEPAAGANVDRNNSSITRTDALNGRLYEAIAEDDRGDLYPDEGRPFDVDPPTLQLEFGGANQGAQPNASLRGVVQIDGDADDEASEIVVFGGTLTADGAFVADDDASDVRLRVFIGTDVLPNAAAAAEACANAPDAAEVAALVDAVCLCAVAEDEQANIAERVLCFTRPLPAVSFEPPSPLSASSVAGPVTVAARVASGFDLSSFDVTGAASVLSTTRPTPDTLQLTVPTSFVDDVNKPDIVVSVAATDIAGRTTPASLSFTRAAPTTSITSPASGAVITAGQQAQLIASASGGYDLATCTVALTASPTQTAPALLAPTRTGTDCSFSQTLAATALPDATWTLTVNASDIVGRAATPATRTFVVDDTAPTVAGLTLAGVTRTINTIGSSRFIAADDPAAPAPRLSTYTATVTATDNFAVSRVVFRVDTPNLADILVCVDGVAGACSSPTAVLVSGQLRACSAANGCTIGGTRTGNNFTGTIADSRDDGARTITVEVFDVNGNERTDGASAVLNKDSVAPAFAWKLADQQDTWHDMSPTAGVQLCRSVDGGTDFRSSCISKPAALVVGGGFRDSAFFVGSTPTTPTNTMHVWRSMLFPNIVLGANTGVVTPTVTAATVGDGTVTVRYGAGTTCPAASALTKSKGLTNGGFVLDLAREDVGFDLNPINNARVCIRAVPVDGAGNNGAAADIFVKWDTVDPPVNVLVNPPDDADPYPTEAFSQVAADARTFITGGRRASLFHAYLSNPYDFATKAKIAPTAALRLNVDDTTSQRTSTSGRVTRWPGNATVPLMAPAFETGNPGGMSWTTSGNSAGDDDAGNQILVKVTTDNANTPAGTKIQDVTLGFSTITRDSEPRTLTFAIDEFKFFSVSTTGVIGAELTPDSLGFVSIPAATSSGFPPVRTAGVVVAVAVGRVTAATSYNVVAPNQVISSPVLLRDTNRTPDDGISPDITNTRFVITAHPFFNAASVAAGITTVDVNGLSGFYVHATNGSAASDFTRKTCSASGSTSADCKFLRRWFELEEWRLVWDVGDGTSLAKVVSVTTRDQQGTQYAFTNTTAQVPTHPFFEGFEGDKQELRVSDAP